MIPLQAGSAEIYNKKHRLGSPGNWVDQGCCGKDGTFWRVATALAEVEPTNKEQWASTFYDAMVRGCIPAGRILANAGAFHLKPNTSLINCVVSGTIPDSIEGIWQLAKESAISLAAGCGIGYCFSTLRPSGAFINGVGASTSGTLSFMNLFDTGCSTIASAGGRRGAQMGTLHCWHPDIYEFIKAKREDGRFRQFNLSVLITDDFIQAVKEDRVWDLYFPVHKVDYENLPAGELLKIVVKFPFHSEEYQYSKSGKEVYCKVYQTVKARDLWDTIIQSTYEFSEPGLLFVDRINGENPLRDYETIVATNPCGR